MDAITYLHIRGTLAENMVYHPRPGHESPRPGRRLDGDPAFALVLLDANGTVLLSSAPRVAPRGCGRAGDPLHSAVRGVLPMHPSATAYELRKGGIVLYRAEIPRQPPSLKVPDCHARGGSATLRWMPGESACDRHLSYSIVACMENERWIHLARGLTGTEHEVYLDALPVAGKGTLLLVASDGIRSTRVPVMALDIPPRPPTAHIIAPADDAHVAFGEVVSALGCLLDMEGRPLATDNCHWHLDGKFLAQGVLAAVPAHLPAGPHRLAFSCEQEGADRIETSTTFTVAAADDDDRRWQALMEPAPPPVPGAAGT